MTDTATPRPRTTSAARMRRLRARRREGEVYLLVTMPPELVIDLRRLGWLGPGAVSDDPAEALAALVNEAFARRIRPR